MKHNYKSWDIRVEDFDSLTTEKEKMAFLIKFGILAPSAHNTQPWKFSIDGNTISVMLSHDRHLPVGDSNNRQAYISIGCAIRAICIAADYYGLSSNVEYFDIPQKPHLAATIRLEKGYEVRTQGNQDHSIFHLLKRVTNRHKYTNEMPSESFIKQIKDLARLDTIIDVIQDQEQKFKIADIAIEAMITAMDNKAFRHELSGFVKNNITKSKVGIPAFGMGIPTPISLFVPTLLKHFNMSKMSKKQDERLLKQFTPMFVIISTKYDNKPSWVNVGEIYMDIAVLAEKNNIKTAPWAAPIQIGDYYKNIQQILHTNFRPQFFTRMGFTNKSMRKSPRLHNTEVIEK